MATSKRDPATIAPTQWLVVAAMSRELAPLRRLALPHLVLRQTGIGMRNAQSTLRRALARERVRAVVNIGLAGALTPSLECGDLIIAQEVRGRDSICPTASLLKAATRIQLQGSKIYAGTIITLDKILCRASEKQQLAQQLSPGTIACVDMESAAVAEVCQQLQTPCLIVRSISDRSAEDLPLDFNRCRKKAGNLDLFRLLFLALQQPTSFYGLLELRRRSRRSAEHLARFVEQLTRMGVEGI